MDKIIIDASDAIQFGDLIGGLMGAVIDAQSQAARATADFILDVGTKEKTWSGNVEQELNTLSFKYKKYNQEGELKDFTLSIPVLGLVEIPAISVKSAKFSFYYDVKIAHDEKSKETKNFDDIAGIGKESKISEKTKMFERSKNTIAGKVNKETNTISNIIKNAGLKVDIEIEKSPISVGIDRILDMLELAAKETDKEREKT